MSRIIAAAAVIASLATVSAKAAEPVKINASFNGWGSGPIQIALLPKAGPIVGAVPVAGTIAPVRATEPLPEVVVGPST